MEIISHENNLFMLFKALSCDRVATAYLFIGKKGVGKFTVALKYANHLTDNKLDIHIVQPSYLEDGKIITTEEAAEKGLNKKTKPLIRIQQIREIPAFISRKPLGNKNTCQFPAKNVVIIDDVQNLQEDGMNALLKSLEEPGEHTTFILVCSGIVPDTISSRCQILTFNRLSNDSILKIGSNKIENTHILDMCDGSYGEAISIKKMLDEVPDQLIASAQTLPTNVLSCMQIARDISILSNDLQIVLLDYIACTMWKKYFNTNIVKIFSDCAKKIREGMQPRLTIEAAYLQLLKF